MAVPRSDSKAGDPADEGSSAGRALNEDHRWLTDGEEPEPERRLQLKVGAVRHPRVRLARGARRRR